MTVVMAMPVVNAKVSAKTRKIFFHDDLPSAGEFARPDEGPP
jgi:hypothetical protein